MFPPPQRDARLALSSIGVLLADTSAAEEKESVGPNEGRRKKRKEIQ
jgi:hypothetical protein